LVSPEWRLDCNIPIALSEKSAAFDANLSTFTQQGGWASAGTRSLVPWKMAVAMAGAMAMIGVSSPPRGCEVRPVQQVDVEFGEEKVDTNFTNLQECGTDRRHLTHLGFAGAGSLAIAEWSTDRVDAPSLLWPGLTRRCPTTNTGLART